MARQGRVTCTTACTESTKLSEAVYRVTWSREPMYEAGSLLFALSIRSSLVAFAMHRPWVVVVQCVLADGT